MQASEKIKDTSVETHDAPDVRAFIESLREYNRACNFFDEDTEIFITRAPGRLDVMGGIADYSGSLVLQMPIAEATLAAAQRSFKASSNPTIKIVSFTNDYRQELIFEMPLGDFAIDGNPITYAAARDYFRRDKSKHWAAYIAGAFLVLMRERGVRFNESVRLMFASRVPEGKGVSSSAALEVATMQALAAAYDVKLEGRELALLCQKVENLIVGAPCGVMDQIASAYGEANKLLALVCQPAEMQGTISLPSDLRVWGMDSGVRHSVGAGDYGSVRTGAFMGYRVLADLAGLGVEDKNSDGAISINDNLWHGYLANITPSEYEDRFAAHVPREMRGGEFLSRYGGTTDSVTSVNPNRIYAVRQPTQHALYENFRVRTFAQLLQSEATARRNELLGELMFQSHASYSQCGLGSQATDLIVESVRRVKDENGLLYGAKITGGGSGGTVAILGHRDAMTAINKIAQEFERRTNHAPYLFAGSSPGSARFGFLKLNSAHL